MVSQQELEAFYVDPVRARLATLTGYLANLPGGRDYSAMLEHPAGEKVNLRFEPANNGEIAVDMHFPGNDPQAVREFTQLLAGASLVKYGPYLKTLPQVRKEDPTTVRFAHEQDMIICLNALGPRQDILNLRPGTVRVFGGREAA